MKQAKILAVVFTVVITCLVLCLIVSADYSLERQVREGQLKLLEAYCDNKISYDEYISRSNELTMKLYDESSVSGYISAEAEKIGNMFKGISNKIGTTAQTYGDKAYQHVADCIWDYLDDYTALSEIETTDKKGYQSLYIKETTSTTGKTTKEYTYFNGYIICYPTDSGYNSYKYVLDDGTCYYQLYRDGILDDDASGYKTGWSSSQSTETSRVNILVYGDVRYSDGSQAPTDETYETVAELDFTNATDSELDELLQDILEELKRQTPDLSTVEGLLESIYYRLGQLDSDNDNEVIAQLNAAIISLANSNNANTSQLILKLDELKKTITGEETGDEETDNNTEEPVDLTEIVKELKEISATVKGLAAIEITENIWELTEDEQELFNEYAALIPVIVNKLGLSFVHTAMSDIESLIFTSSVPNDLTVNMYGSDYAILSQSMFDNEAMEYINLAKTFISVVLIYTWCMSMRKKLTGGDS